MNNHTYHVTVALDVHAVDPEQEATDGPDGPDFEFARARAEADRIIKRTAGLYGGDQATAHILGGVRRWHLTFDYQETVEGFEKELEMQFGGRLNVKSSEYDLLRVKKTTQKAAAKDDS